MDTLWFVLLLIIIALYIVATFLGRYLRYQKWEAEYAELRRRKEEILQKRSPDQPVHCPFCGEIVPPALSGYAECSRCGRDVMTR